MCFFEGTQLGSKRLLTLFAIFESFRLKFQLDSTPGPALSSQLRSTIDRKANNEMPHDHTHFPLDTLIYIIDLVLCKFQPLR